VYTGLVGFGLAPNHKIIDIACGTGLAGGPLAENNYDVTGVDLSTQMIERARKRYPQARFVEASALKLPFDSESFDFAISGQAFHHFDRTVAMREALRVVRPGGGIAIWWKYLMSDDPVKIARDETTRELGFEPVQSGLIGGFKEFYAAPLREHSLRVVPWRVAQPLSKYMEYEKSRASVREALGPTADAYFLRLENRLAERSGQRDPVLSLSFMHYVYLGKK
ncbi:MAG: methyltransferase domain-containing protein, partial [Candidatus Eremiobacteraeota bacterium]|nr:methyltransferase domain-containing protein [Candidatus Eremiobacteraeota bacterium]